MGRGRTQDCVECSKLLLRQRVRPWPFTPRGYLLSTYFPRFTRFQTSLSTWHAFFVTRCTRPTPATTASIFLVEATDTPITLIRRGAIQRVADPS